MRNLLKAFFLLLLFSVFAVLLFSFAACSKKPAEPEIASTPLPSVPDSDPKIYPFYNGPYTKRGNYGFIDSSGSIVIEPKFSYCYNIIYSVDYINDITHYGYEVPETIKEIDHTPLRAYYSADGKIKTDFRYLSLYVPVPGIAIGYLPNENREIIDLHTGQVLISHNKEISFLNSNLVCLEQEDGKDQIINLNGEKVAELPLNTRLAAPSMHPNRSDQLFTVVSQGTEEETSLYGYINESGKIIIPMQYMGAEVFENGRAIVFTDKELLVIDPNNNVLMRLEKDLGQGQIFGNNLIMHRDYFENSVNDIHSTSRLYTIGNTDPLLTLDDYILFQMGDNCFGAALQYHQGSDGKVSTRPKQFRYFDSNGIEFLLPANSTRIIYMMDDTKWILERDQDQNNSSLERVIQYAYYDGKHEVIPFGTYTYLNTIAGNKFLIGNNATNRLNDLIDLEGNVIISDCKVIDPHPDGTRLWIERGSYSGYIDLKGQWLYKQSVYNELLD